jgi:hypothetical protein
MVDVGGVDKAWMHFRKVLNAKQLHHRLHLIFEDCQTGQYSEMLNESG